MLVVLLTLTSADVTIYGSCVIRLLLPELATEYGNSSTASQTINVQDKRLQ
jgi:hypothetical protein